MPKVPAHGCFIEDSVTAVMLASQRRLVALFMNYLDFTLSLVHLFPILTGGRYYVTKGETEAMQEVVSDVSSPHSCLNSGQGMGGWVMSSSVPRGAWPHQRTGSKLTQRPGIGHQRGASSSDCP